jgi:hypothetical protein
LAPYDTPDYFEAISSAGLFEQLPTLCCQCLSFPGFDEFFFAKSALNLYAVLGLFVAFANDVQSSTAPQLFDFIARVLRSPLRDRVLASETFCEFFDQLMIENPSIQNRFAAIVTHATAADVRPLGELVNRLIGVVLVGGATLICLSSIVEVVKRDLTRIWKDSSDPLFQGIVGHSGRTNTTDDRRIVTALAILIRFVTPSVVSATTRRLSGPEEIGPIVDVFWKVCRERSTTE